MSADHDGLTAQGDALPAFSEQAEPSLARFLPLTLQIIERKRVHTICARQLHAFLKVGRDFSSWIQNRITTYGFMSGVDYLVVDKLRSPDSGSSKARKQWVKEYILSLDTAKELAMVERNEEGRRARRYFIDCERRFTEISPEQHALTVANWQAERAASKSEYAIMCEALKQHRLRQGKETRGVQFGNEAKMLNQLVLGMDAKLWAKKHGVSHDIRQHMSGHELELMAYLERANATLLDADMPFAERKQRLTTMVTSHQITLRGGSVGHKMSRVFHPDDPKVAQRPTVGKGSRVVRVKGHNRRATP